VAVVIGAAFGAVVTAFVADLVTPLIAAIGGKPDFNDLTFSINSSVFKYGAVLTALITFLAIAAVVFFLIVRPMNMIAAIGGKPDFGDLAFTINDSRFAYGHFINAVISFLIIAAVIFFFVVKPLNALAARRKAEDAEPEAPADDVRLLTEIRDLLAQPPASETPSRPT
jgi:large conductance mechanosensitive channel